MDRQKIDDLRDGGLAEQVLTPGARSIGLELEPEEIEAELACMAGREFESGIVIGEDEEIHYVNEYELNRGYGGPEEGGWWFDTGRFVRCHGVFKSLDDARRLAGLLRDGEIAEKRAGCYPPGSVLCAGWPEVLVEDHPGRDYPRRRPHYE